MVEETAIVSSTPSEQGVTPETENSSFELYSTLAGKMARMEELYNSIERFLGDEDFKDRLLADSKELLQLITECRELYPDELETSDQTYFSRAIDQTAETAKTLIASLEDNDNSKAKELLGELDEIRRKSHAKFSY